MIDVMTAVSNRLTRKTALEPFNFFMSRTEGVAAIEFAIIIPLLLVMFFGIIDLGLGIYTDMQVTSASQAGAQYALNRGFDKNGISGAVTSATSLGGIAASPGPSQFCGCPSSAAVVATTCSTVCSNGSPAGTYVSVSAAATYTTLLPYPGIPNSFSFASTSTARLQ